MALGAAAPTSNYTECFTFADFRRIPWNLSPRKGKGNVKQKRNAQIFANRRPRMLVSVRASSSSSANSNVLSKPSYKRVSDCIVFPAAAKPRAIVHFIGGAFIGAVPEVTYSCFIELLTQRDFLVIATPYNVTFEHLVAAETVDQRFWNCRGTLISGEFTLPNLSPKDIADLPVLSIGHSNGALLQLLIGCSGQDLLPKANAVIAFNNKPATDAVPYFEQLGPITAQFAPVIAATSVFDLSRSIPGVSLNGLLAAASPILGQYDQESLQSLQNFMEQIPLVLDQVSKGTSEFTPAPIENRRTIKSNYNVKDTLLVQYKVDAIDETEIVEEILKPRVQETGGNLQKITINGNHVTPCVQDIRWEIGKLYTPADAVRQALRGIALAEIRETVASVSSWFETFL